MTFRFVSNLHLHVSETNPEFILNDTFHLITDPNIPRKWAKETGDFIMNKFGVVILETLTRFPCYLSVIENEETYLKEYNIPNIETAAVLDVITLQTFNLYSWIVKDNSISLGSYFYHNDSTKNVFLRHGNVHYCNCQGLYADTVFTVKELNEAQSIFKKIFEISDTTQYKGIVPNPDAAKQPGVTYLNANEEDYNSHNRITRSLMFLDSARSSTHLPLKIAFYIGMLECLFSLEAGEISHRVAERVSLYIGTDSESKKEIYKKVKTAYDVRSKYMHGQILSKGKRTKEQLLEISSETDELLRRVIKKVITEDVKVFKDMGDEEIRGWYENLLFR